jgi:NADH-quinone oxidoreductase subunit F
VRRPGVYDVGLGTPVRGLIEQHGLGPSDGWGLVFPAGPSAPPLLPDALRTPLDPDALRAAGSGLGSASLLVTAATLSPLHLGLSLARFFEREACGQCPPCVVGTGRLAGFVAHLTEGRSRPAELGHLSEAAEFMRPHGYCAHGRTAASVITALLDRCRPAVEACLAGQPDPGRHGDPFGPESPERQAIEAWLG